MKGKLTLGLTALLVLVAALGATAPVAAHDTTNTTDTTMLHESYEVDNDTEALRVVAQNITNGTADVTITDATSNGTTVLDATLDTSNSSVTMDSVELGTINASKTYHVQVIGDGAASLNVNEVTTVAAGGGGSGGLEIGSLTSDQEIAVIAIGAVFIVLVIGWWLKDQAGGY